MNMKPRYLPDLPEALLTDRDLEDRYAAELQWEREMEEYMEWKQTCKGGRDEQK